MAPTPKIFQTGAMKMEPGLATLSNSEEFTVVFATNVFTIAADMSLSTGDAVRVSTSAADLPDPLVINTNYYWIAITSVTGKLATTKANALAGIKITIVDAGTGTHTMEDWQSASDGWGGSTGVVALGAGDAFPWTSFGNKLNVDTEEDASVTTKAFKSTPRMIGKNVDNPVGFYGRYKSINRFNYWMFGFENVVQEVVVCRGGADPFDTDPAIGDVGEDTHGVPKDFRFLRSETTRTETLYIFETMDSAVVTGLTISGTGTATWVFTLTSASAIMYEHLYELDGVGRRFRAYTLAERAVHTSLYANDRRNLQATFGKKMDQYDLRYQNSMCKNFGLKITAAGMAMWESNYMGYTEARGDYSSDAWTLATGLSNTTLVPAHMEYRFSIGETITEGTDGAISGLTELGMSDINLEVQTPLQAIQDTISGLSFAEPVLEGAYGIRMLGTISRHSIQTYQTLRDAQTLVRAHLIANQGNYMQEIMVKEATLSESGPDDSDVAAEPLALEVGYVEGSSQWSTFLNDVTETQDSPILYRVRDDSSVNAMLAQ